VGKRQALTEKGVHRLQRKARRYSLPDVAQLGLVLRVPPDPRKPISYVAVSRRPKGRQIWHQIGQSHFMTLDEARERARDVVRKIRLNLPLNETAPATVTHVCEKWLELVVRERNYRGAKERERIIRKYLIPEFGNRPVHDIRRVDINELIDGIAKTSGLTSANQVLKTVSAIMAWWQSRDDSFKSPIVRGMVRGSATKRDRILSDDEIRKIWAACEACPGGNFIRFSLLVAQRHGVLAAMRWRDVHGDVWDIPTESAREKGNIERVRLPALAMQVLRSQPHIAGAPIFGRQQSHVSRQIRKASGVHGWTVHDCRRTARTLMSRAHISTEVAELVLGHARGKLLQVYDQYSFFEEKSHALAALAQLIEIILSPPSANIIAMGGV
jgi:integrase